MANLIASFLLGPMNIGIDLSSIGEKDNACGRNGGAGVLFGPDVTARFCEEPAAAASLV